MDANVSALVKKIKEVQFGIVQDESHIVLKYVEIGQLLLQLKRVAKSDWENEVQKLGYPPRVARRYMAIGRTWWAGSGLQESGVINQLPPDLMKLEWLCRLDKDQLLGAIHHWPCRKWSRTLVIDAVKHDLKIIEKPKATRPPTLDRITIDCERVIDRLVEALEDSADEIADPESRQRLWDDLNSRFAKVENLLATNPADGFPSAGSDETETEEARTEPVANQSADVVDAA